MMKFDPVTRKFTYEAEKQAALDAQAQQWVQNQEWGLMGEAIERMIRLRKPYESWVTRFYQVSSQPEAPVAPSVAVEDYVATAQTGSPQQTSLYQRATFTFKQPSIEWIGGGGWYSMRDTRHRGWDPVQEVARQIAEEQAKKLDTTLYTAFHAGIAGGQKTSVSELDFDTFRGIVASASDAGFPVTNMVATPGRMMDTANWGTSNVTWLWSPLPQNFGSQIAVNGYISNFMGISFEQLASMPGTKIYFFGNNAEMGRYLDAVGPMTRLSDMDIDNKTVRFNMDQLYYYYTVSCADVWEVTIV
jgi:hypothetical protein